MTVSALDVVSGDERVGVLRRAQGAITFTYDESWQQWPGATPLSVSMPLGVRAHGDEVVQPWLWGLLPDNDRVLQRWARELHTTAKHPLGLLAGVGRDLPGQFQLVADASGHAAASHVERLTDSDVAALLSTVRKDHTAWHGTQSLAGRWSLGGAQAKIALRRDGQRWGRPQGREATTHILKPAIVELDDHDLNEHLCMRAASLAGLRVAPSTILTFGTERAICVERYDRIVRSDGTVLRVHQEDLCQALGVHPEQKYESDGGPGVSQVGALLAAAMPGDAGVDARERFLDALALSWLIGGTDAHAKNYALLLAGSQVRMAPLYDVASALPYADVHVDKLKLAMRIGGRYLAQRLGADHWGRAAAQLGMEPEAGVGRVAALAERLPAAFERAAAEPNVLALGSALPARLVELVSRRCAALGARLS